jgi:hypothetical protein
MVDGERSGSLRYVTSIAGVIAVLALVGCGALTLLPRQGDPVPVRLMTVKDLAAAYARVQPGLTRTTQLTSLGFDLGAANSQALSYLGVMERFMPRDSVRFDRLNAVVQDCIAARDHCTALVFRPMDRSHTYTWAHHSLLSAFGLGAAAAAVERTPEITLLVRDGRIAFKMISGLPAVHVQSRVRAGQAPRDGSGYMPVSYRVTN